MGSHFNEVGEVSFSNSTFTIELNGTATVAFRAKWQSEADDIGQGWIGYHWHQLPTKGPLGEDVPLVKKIRIARPAEKASYEAEGNSTEFYEGLKMVYLVELSSLS
jgi:hypothetical protein